MLIFLLMRRSRRYLSKSNRERSTSRQKLVTARESTPLLDAPPEILRWQVEMYEVARDLKAELDSKMGALQAIIRIANEESARLEAAIARAEQLGVSPCADTLAAIEELNGSQDSSGQLPVRRRSRRQRRNCGKLSQCLAISSCVIPSVPVIPLMSGQVRAHAMKFIISMAG